MYARSTTFQGKPEDIDAGIAMVRDEVMPALREMDGCIGVSMLVDRETGSSIVTAAWETEEAMRSSAQRVAPLRDRAAQLFSTRPEVREWEIAVLHRERPVVDGACARVTWTRTDPARMEEQLDIFRDQVLPRLEQLPGFCSVSLLIDRESGKAALAATYESREALMQAREAAKGLREESAQQTRMEILDIAEFEVALAHLRVPETV